jgi:hypothetical protein
MHTLFSEVGIRPWDFLQLSTFFLLTMVIFFGIKEKRYLWLNYLMLVIFGLQSLFFILFHEGLQIKLFAAVMLMSALTIEVISIRRRKLDRQK